MVLNRPNADMKSPGRREDKAIYSMGVILKSNDLHNVKKQTIHAHFVVSSAAGCRYTGSNRIISFVVIKYKKVFSHAATETNPTEKRASCTSRVMFCSLKVA